jgi:hypothetical protein
MIRNNRPDSPPKVRAPRWFSVGLRQLGLLSPFLATTGIVWLAWGLYGTSDFHVVPAIEIQRLIASARISGSDATTAAVREYTAHLAWNTLAGFYLVFFVATVLLGIWVICRVLEATPRCGMTGRWQWIAFLAVLFSIASWYVVDHIGYGMVSGALLKPTVFAQTPSLPARQQFFSSGGQITALFLAALSSLTLPSPGCTDERCLRCRIALLRLVLGAGTALLVVDVMRENALLAWALGFVDPSDTAAARTLQSLASTIVAGRGVLGTVLLATIYLPAASILRGQVWAAVPSTIATIPEATQWLQDRGLIAASGVAQLRPIVAVLLPLLTGVLSGPAGEVLRNLTKP